MSVPCETGICLYKQQHSAPAWLHDCADVRVGLNEMACMDIGKDECSYAAIAAENEKALADPNIARAAGLTAYIGHGSIGSGEKPEDLLD